MTNWLISTWIGAPAQILDLNNQAVEKGMGNPALGRDAAVSSRRPGSHANFAMFTRLRSLRGLKHFEGLPDVLQRRTLASMQIDAWAIEQSWHRQRDCRGQSLLQLNQKMIALHVGWRFCSLGSLLSADLYDSRNYGCQQTYPSFF